MTKDELKAKAFDHIGAARTAQKVVRLSDALKAVAIITAQRDQADEATVRWADDYAELQERIAELERENADLKQLEDMCDAEMKLRMSHDCTIFDLERKLAQAKEALEQYAREELWSNADHRYGAYLEWPKIGPDVARAALAQLGESSDAS